VLTMHKDTKITVSEGLAMSTDDENVIEFPGADAEQKRQLRERAEWRAIQPQVEWEMYLAGDASRFDITPAEIRRLILAGVRVREKQKKEEQAIVHSAERKREKQEKKDRADRKEEERKERADRRDAEKRQKELERIVALPASEHESELKKLAERSRAD